MTTLRQLGAQASRLLRATTLDPVEIRALLAELVRTAGVRRKLTQEDRFWRHVAYSPRCWLWVGATNTAGEPVVRFGGTLQTAARVAWYLATGKEPPPRLYRTCATKRCIRPAHRAILVPLRGTLGAPPDAAELLPVGVSTWACPRGHVLLAAPPGGRCPMCHRLNMAHRRRNRADRLLRRHRAQPQGGASAPPT